MLVSARNNGLESEQLLAGTGVYESDLLRGKTRITLRQQARLVRNITRAPNSQGAGISIALDGALTKIGIVGYGMMSCQTLRRALCFGEKYISLVAPVFTLSSHEEKGWMVIRPIRNAPLGKLERFAVEQLLVSIYRFVELLLGRTGHRNGKGIVEIRFSGLEPAYFESFSKHLPNTKFESAFNEIRISSDCLDSCLASSNMISLAEATAICEKELSLHVNKRTALEKVKTILDETEGLYPTIAEIAKRLHMSVSTLKRKLHEHGQTYSSLVDEAKRWRAVRLLERIDLNLADVSEIVGYTDRANFSRAFKRWTGLSPSEHRTAAISRLPTHES